MIKIGILIYDGAEVLDFSGPFEVFSTASRLSEQDKFDVILLSEQGGLVKARGGFEVNTLSIDDINTLDIIIVSGGVHTNIVGNSMVEKWLVDIAEQVDIVASICTGAFLLASSGIITSQQVTTHWQDQQDLQTQYPNLTVIPDKRWLQQGKIFTSGGIAAGIDLSLHLVSLLAEHTLAVNTAKQMEVIWHKNK